MRPLQYLKVDWIRCKTQLRIMLAFPLISLLFLFGSNQNELFVCEYLVFGAIIISAQPFNMEQLSESGFINMLPGTKRDRVAGRYLFALVLLIISVLLGIVVSYSYDTYRGIDFRLAMTGIWITFALGMVICSLQYILYYAIGKGRSQQMMVIIRMIPAFIMFFISGYMTDMIVQGKFTYLNWVNTHSMELSVVLVIAGILIYLMGIAVSSKLIQKKDFA